jgi:hypothetical protein
VRGEVCARLFFVGKPEVMRPLVRSTYRWEDNIKMGLQDFGWEHGLNSPSSGYIQV